MIVLSRIQYVLLTIVGGIDYFALNEKETGIILLALSFVILLLTDVLKELRELRGDR